MLKPIAIGHPKELTGLAGFIETVKPVLPIGAGPVANAGMPQVAPPHTPVQLDGTKSSDPINRTFMAGTW